MGVVPVPDARLDALAAIDDPARIVPATVEFVDIAGLVAGASQGEGLGNQFLANIRETDAICEVVRFFGDPDVVHVSGRVDPLSDVETIKTELILADLATLEKAHPAPGEGSQARQGGRQEAGSGEEGVRGPERRPSRAHPGPGRRRAGGPLRFAPAHDEAHALHRQRGRGPSGRRPARDRRLQRRCPSPRRWRPTWPSWTRPRRRSTWRAMGLEESGLARLVREAYRLLGLQSYFTSGETETRAWTIPIGAKAPQAAGVIHTDFERGFIKAETACVRRLRGAGRREGLPRRRQACARRARNTSCRTGTSCTSSSTCRRRGPKAVLPYTAQTHARHRRFSRRGPQPHDLINGRPIGSFGGGCSWLASGRGCRAVSGRKRICPRLVGSGSGRS